MKLKAKKALFLLLDKLPEKWGFIFYHFSQNTFGNQNLNLKIQSNLKSYETLKKILKELGFKLKNKSVLEVGSGWLPLMPYFIKFLGEAREVVSVDLNKHYNAKSIKSLNTFFSRKFDIRVEGNGKFQLPNGISYFPNTDINTLKGVKADFVFSRFVLEHVTPKDLVEMHKKFKVSLPTGSLIVHFISPSDHRAYEDNSLSLQDFLQFSEQEWDEQQTKFDYHNRWRLPQYLELFKNTGLEVIYLDYEIPKRESTAWKKFRGLNIHPDFKVFPEEELMAGNIQVVLKVPMESPTK